MVITAAYNDKLRCSPSYLLRNIMKNHPDREVRMLAYGILVNRGEKG